MAAPPTFDPVKLGLPADFVLTDYTRLKGCSCKVPQPKLLVLLESIRQHNERAKAGGELDAAEVERQRLADVGMDCSIVPIKSKAAAAMAGGDSSRALFMVSTTDFFFPSVEDPFLQGRIGCANVLSDLYSMGISECDTLLMLLAASTDMEESERYTVTLEMMKGFAAAAREGDVAVTGGQTVLNPWPLIGGVAMSVAAKSEMVLPDGIVAGDVFVLTKPLGVQLAVNLQQWTRRPSPLYKAKVEGRMSVEEIHALYAAATAQMARLNRNGAVGMQKYGAHGCTDVTGFGLLGHAKNLAQAQQNAVTIEITHMPVLRGAVVGERLLGGKYKLFEGLSAETSGGLLVAFPDEATAQAYMDFVVAADGCPAWIVGRAVPRDTEPDGSPCYARLTSEVSVIEV